MSTSNPNDRAQNNINEAMADAYGADEAIAAKPIADFENKVIRSVVDGIRGDAETLADTQASLGAKGLAAADLVTTAPMVIPGAGEIEAGIKTAAVSTAKHVAEEMAEHEGVAAGLQRTGAGNEIVHHAATGGAEQAEHTVVEADAARNAQSRPRGDEPAQQHTQSEQDPHQESKPHVTPHGPLAKELERLGVHAKPVPEIPGISIAKKTLFIDLSEHSTDQLAGKAIAQGISLATNKELKVHVYSPMGQFIQLDSQILKALPEESLHHTLSSIERTVSPPEITRIEQARNATGRAHNFITQAGDALKKYETISDFALKAVAGSYFARPWLKWAGEQIAKAYHHAMMPAALPEPNGPKPTPTRELSPATPDIKPHTQKTSQTEQSHSKDHGLRPTPVSQTPADFHEILAYLAPTHEELRERNQPNIDRGPHKGPDLGYGR